MYMDAMGIGKNNSFKLYITNKFIVPKAHMQGV